MPNGYAGKSIVTVVTGLKGVVRGDGVWRIRRQDGSPLIELFKIGESGTGSVLPDSFKSWRAQFDNQKE